MAAPPPSQAPASARMGESVGGIPGRFCPQCRIAYGADHQFCPEHGERLEEGLRCLAGKFILKREIGSGQMGAVYHALQVPMRRPVAVKILKDSLSGSEPIVQRFIREAEILSRIEHDNVVAIYDCGSVEAGPEDGGQQVYLAMEYLEGEDLAQLLRREGALSIVRAMPLWLEVVSAMAAAHRAGVVHRDLKPENIMVARKQWPGGPDKTAQEVVKVLDFGVAKIVAGPAPAPAQTTPGTLVGTWLYMSPEQLSGRDTDARSDVFALGVLLARMLSGRFPWGLAGDESWDAVVLRISHRPLPLHKLCPGRTFSPELQGLLDEVLDPNPQRRPKDAGALQLRLQQVPEVTGPRAEVIRVPVEVREREPQEPAPPPDSRRWGRVLGVVAAVLCLLPVAYLSLRRPPPQPARLAAPVRPVPVPEAQALPDPGPQEVAVAPPAPVPAPVPVPVVDEAPLREHRSRRHGRHLPAPPPVTAPKEQPPRQPAPPREEPPRPAERPERRPERLSVRFQVHDLGVEVACGRGGQLRPACAGPGSCRVTLSPGEHCEAHSNGFKPFRPRSFDFDHLQEGAQDGAVQVDL